MAAILSDSQPGARVPALRIAQRLSKAEVRRSDAIEALYGARLRALFSAAPHGATAIDRLLGRPRGARYCVALCRYLGRLPLFERGRLQAVYKHAHGAPANS